MSNQEPEQPPEPAPAAPDPQMELPGMPPEAPNYDAERKTRDMVNRAKSTQPNQVYEDKLFKYIKWATGK